MKGIGYATSLINLFISLGQFEKTRGVNIKSIKDKSSDLNINSNFTLSNLETKKGVNDENNI